MGRQPGQHQQSQYRPSTPVPLALPGGPMRRAPFLPEGTRGDLPVGKLKQQFLEMLQPRLGRGAFERLTTLVDGMALWALGHWTLEKGPRTVFFWSQFRRAYRKLVRDVTFRALTREWLDERITHAAEVGGLEERNRWLTWSLDQVRFLGWLFPRRWHVAGMSFEEMESEVMIKLLSRLEEVRAGKKGWPASAPGVGPSMKLADATRAYLRKRKMIMVAHAPLDVQTLIDSTRSQYRTPSPEAPLLEKQHEASLQAFALELDTAPLSTIQRRWLDTVRHQVHEDGSINWSSVAAVLGRGPSAGSLMKKKFKELFGERAKELGLLDE